MDPWINGRAVPGRPALGSRRPERNARLAGAVLRDFSGYLRAAGIEPAFQAAQGRRAEYGGSALGVQTVFEPNTAGFGLFLLGRSLRNLQSVSDSSGLKPQNSQVVYMDHLLGPS